MDTGLDFVEYTVNLECSDGTINNVPIKQLERSKLLMEMIGKENFYEQFTGDEEKILTFINNVPTSVRMNVVKNNVSEEDYKKIVDEHKNNTVPETIHLNLLKELISPENYDLVLKKCDKIILMDDIKQADEELYVQLTSNQSFVNLLQHTLPIPNVTCQIMNTILQWMKHHVEEEPCEIEKPVKTNKMTDIVSEWDAQYIIRSCMERTNILCAANYLDMEPLMALCAAKIATLCRGKTPEHIKHVLDINYLGDGEGPDKCVDEEKKEE